MDKRALPVTVPVLRVRSAHPFVPAFAADDAEFSQRLLSTLPELEGFDLKRHGLFLAGGCAAALLCQHSCLPSSFGDADFFLVGHADDAARRAAIEALGAHLALRWAPAPCILRRTPNAVTFTTPHRPPIQVVLRGYSTEAEVLHGFDLGSSSIGFDGSLVLLTELGALAAERGLNILCLDGWRGSYERRLAKYACRGVGVVLLRLDQAFVSQRCEARLPTCPRLSFYNPDYSTWPLVTCYGFNSSVFSAAEGSGTYEDGHTLRGDSQTRNARCLLGTSPRLAGIEAVHPYEGPASLDRPAAMGEGFMRLAETLRKKPAAAGFTGPLRHYAALPAASTFVEEVGKLLLSLAALHAEGYSFPLEFRGVEADTLLTPEEGRLTEEEWYSLPSAHGGEGGAGGEAGAPPADKA